MVAEGVDVLVGERPIPRGKYSQSLFCATFSEPAQDAGGLHDAEKVALERVDPGALQRVWALEKRVQPTREFAELAAATVLEVFAPAVLASIL
ncbi:MAG: hypothetical protein EPN48_15265 [Microbacteriaceae bacterium]|nr:MAG: hypothetical protein EPN48_15265 [Microbacteriaceae bacterium]